MDEELLNIRPEASILGVFSRLNYKPWYAIAEFVDNSTASFFEHKQTMKFHKIKKMRVDITYNALTRTLIIKDDAYGMEIEDFKRAIKLDSKPENQSGRNEFGMGLKTAASWFGNVWSVESTRLDSENKYYAKVDINKLKEDKLNDIVIEKSICTKEQHGTKIIIEEITKPIDASRTKAKIKSLLQSMYRRDIISGEVDIYFMGEKLTFVEYDILNYKDKDWKKDINFKFEFGGEEYSVGGFVGILGPKSSGFTKAGFALFRRGRVILGGDEENYKPREIFGQAQSTISHKLFGEIDLDDFPVNQAKDGFVWDTGLEDKFILSLKEQIKDYIQIAKLTNQQRSHEEDVSPEVSKIIQNDVASSFSGILLDVDTDDNYNKPCDVNKTFDDHADEFSHAVDTDDTSKIHDETERNYTIDLDSINSITIKVKWATGKNKNWFDYDETNSSVIINIDHKFFKPFSNDRDFKVLIEKFVISFVISEQMARKECTEDGYIKPSSIRNKMNNYLGKLSENNKV